MSTTLTAGQLHWVSGVAPSAPHRCCAKTRYRDSDHACVIESIDQDTATVHFDEPQRAVTPGQSVVFYEGKRCLGGGTIIGGGARSRRSPASYAA
jgi:tRNA-specific 2-thiouridylase